MILGGPNGAGKTTAARVLLPEFFKLNEFLNADEIARGIAPNDPESVALSAGRRMIQRMREYVAEGRSFGFETTCSGKSYLPLLERCKRDGWRITLIFLWLPTPDHAMQRVAQRIRQGGHGIPEDTIVRRFFGGLSNMRRLYLPLADSAKIYDNGGERKVLIAEKEHRLPLEVYDLQRWSRIEEMIRGHELT